MATSILLFYLLLVLPCFVDSVSFNFTSFQRGDPGNVIYHGDASLDGAVVLGNTGYTSRVGWVTYAEKVPIWNSRTGKLTNFNTSFSFIINTRNASSGNFGHGLCFFLAPVGIQLLANSAGGFLGLFNQVENITSSFPLVHVEFDTFQNVEWDPLETESHVGINNNSLVSSNYTSWNATKHNQAICNAHISYDSATKNLSVYWAYKLTSDPRENSSLSYIIDLATVLPPQVTIGFSATTGAVTEGHRLLSWEFSSSLDSEKASIRTGLIVGFSISGFVFLISLVIFVLVWLHKKRKRKAKEITDLISINEDLDKEAGPRRFAYKDLVLATNRFSAQRKLGEGGFGAVYRGFLNEIDSLVAVKKLSGRSRQGKREFLTEVKIISKLRHRNLVQLIGWYKIALGLAYALLYLHEEWDQCVLHRDIKASNIMLDTNFNVKLGDFGLARLMDHDLRSHTTGLAGTFGYMAPEYSVDHSEENIEAKSLVERVWDLYGRQQLMSAMDEKLGEEFNMEQAECLIIVGLWCGHPDRNSRPSVRQAIQVLNLESPLPNLPHKMPVPTYHISPTSLSVSSSRGSVTFSSCKAGR
ncbi:BnaA02g10020D [Brassica napus]|uniref:BnaA02g10020D protein n=1 Tax=Brassica napus TaxID=3708 RepID=A0A078GQJ8_BRANA|nr:BnaA02g10020D [Brassica napus]